MVIKIVNNYEVSRCNVNKSSLIIMQGEVGMVYIIKGYFLGLLLYEVIAMLFDIFLMPCLFTSYTVFSSHMYRSGPTKVN